MENFSGKELSILVHCPLFKGLREDELWELLAASSSRMKRFSKGDLVAQAGEEVFFLHIILEGSVKGEMIDYTGKVIKIEDIQAPRPLAPAFLYGKNNSYPVNITASEDLVIVSIPVDEFLNLMHRNETVLKNFVNNVSTRGQFLSNKIKFLSFTSIKGKLAQYLLDLAGKAGSDRIILQHSQSQLSELFGVARPSVGRAISEMNHEGIIRTNGKVVELLNKAKLSALLR